MRFTADQYDQAIENLMFAKAQLEPDSNNCSICDDSGHMAYECGHNPLVAVAVCDQIARESSRLHDTLHLLAGYQQAFGVTIGPARCVMPSDEADAPQE